VIADPSNMLAHRAGVHREPMHLSQCRFPANVRETGDQVSESTERHGDGPRSDSLK